MVPPSTLLLNVRRNEPELVRPARPTPGDLKPLSDLDVLDLFRYQQPVILAYAAAAGCRKDPAKVIKAALAEALVYYYPWAGRLREGLGGRLMVDCTAEGVAFVEADADARLDQFGEEGSLVPPFPCADQLLYNRVSNTFAVVDCPIFTIQVTRLVCGGFIVAFQMCHVMSDLIGIVQFLNTVAEIARGASSPSILPVWQRHLMNARDPPHVTCPLPDYEDQRNKPKPPQDDLVCRTFIFSDREIAALHACVPRHLHPCTAFELVSVCIWHCRTIALQYRPEEEVHLAFPVDIRDKSNPPFPIGYYGNAGAVAISASLAGEICNNSFGYTVELVKKAKGAMTEEHMGSLVDLAVWRGRRFTTIPNIYNMSDVSSRIYGFSRVDFGWGMPVYSGPPDNGFASHCFSFIMSYRNGKGKVVSVSLPVDAMDRFVDALRCLFRMNLTSKI